MACHAQSPPSLSDSLICHPCLCSVTLELTTLVTYGFTEGLALTVACHIQEEFPETLIPLFTLPSKPMLKEPMTSLHGPYLATPHWVSCPHSRGKVTWVSLQLHRMCIGGSCHVPCPRKLWQKGHEFEASLDSIVRPCLRKRRWRVRGGRGEGRGGGGSHIDRSHHFNDRQFSLR